MAKKLGLNTILSIVNYAISSGLNWQAITLGGLITSGIFGAVGGFLGGAGWSNGTDVTQLLKLDTTKIF